MDKIKRHKQDLISLVIGILGCSLWACRPVITVGWGEILILALVIVILIGPIIYRFLRRGPGSNGEADQRDDDQRHV